MSTLSAGDATKYKLPRQLDEGLDLSNLITHNQWTSDELGGIEQTHRNPGDLVDKCANWSIKLVRCGFDLFSGYMVKSWTGGMRERDWVRRIIFLETVAGVPGMVAGMVRHLHSLRLMRRDYGWIHSLLAEAENERMHLLIALNLRRPGPVFRFFVICGQGVFLTFFTTAYLVCPRYCHRFVGYLEEEAVHTYTRLIEEIDAGKLPMFSNLKAPPMAKTYYNLPPDAMIRDVFACIRADESCHRDSNHHFADLRPDEPNTMVDHLRKGHFQHSNVFSGVSHVIGKMREKAVLDEFKKFDLNGTGFISEAELRQVMRAGGEEVSDEEVSQLMKAADQNGDGKIDYQEFVRMMKAENTPSV